MTCRFRTRAGTSTATTEHRWGQILADERFRYLMLQRSVAKRSGVRQPSLSAYERCRATPSWDVFVRILAAMDRKAVIRTEPLDPTPVSISSVRGAIDDVMKVIGGRRYRLEHEAAAHVLGRGDQIAKLRVSVEADPTKLDELAEAAVGRFRPVYTKRGGGLAPQVHFDTHGGTVVLTVVREARRSVEVAFEGLMVHVAPFEEIELPAA